MPAGVVAAMVSTVSAATLIYFISSLYEAKFPFATVLVINAIIGPVLAYVIYLLVYYSIMLGLEKRRLLRAGQQLSMPQLKEWLVTVKYDYIAHLPSDIYLISLAAVMQATLQSQGMNVFYALLLSQFVDDFITFLKEPVIWSGAKEIARWEGRSETSLYREVLKLLRISKLPNKTEGQ